MKALENLFSLFYPNRCVLCGETLAGQENFLCLSCRTGLPTTDQQPDTSNSLRERLHGKVALDKTYAHLFYDKDGVGQRIISEIKYRGNIRFGVYMGQLLANELVETGFFQSVDYLIPVPLHPAKQRKRGFNQAEAIVRGIASVVGIAQDKASLIRLKSNESQTAKGSYDRWLNTQGLFVIKDQKKFEGKHILLVDDVITTGATINACMQPFLSIPGIRISLLTLATT